MVQGRSRCGHLAWIASAESCLSCGAGMLVSFHCCFADINVGGEVTSLGLFSVRTVNKRRRKQRIEKENLRPTIVWEGEMVSQLKHMLAPSFLSGFMDLRPLSHPQQSMLRYFAVSGEHAQAKCLRSNTAIPYVCQQPQCVCSFLTTWEHVFCTCRDLTHREFPRWVISHAIAPLAVWHFQRSESDRTLRYDNLSSKCKNGPVSPQLSRILSLSKFSAGSPSIPTEEAQRILVHNLPAPSLPAPLCTHWHEVYPQMLWGSGIGGVLKHLQAEFSPDPFISLRHPILGSSDVHLGAKRSSKVVGGGPQWFQEGSWVCGKVCKKGWPKERLMGYVKERLSLRGSFRGIWRGLAISLPETSSGLNKLWVTHCKRLIDTSIRKEGAEALLMSCSGQQGLHHVVASISKSLEVCMFV